MADWQLAELNIARMLAPRDSPTMAEFMARLDEINGLADEAPGFVWRLKDESGNATAIDALGDTWLIINMSVWESVEALKDFTYASRHNEVMRKRRQWFEPHMEMYFVMWWVPAGDIPTPEEAQARLAHLQAHGESAHAFTFRSAYPAPETRINVA